MAAVKLSDVEAMQYEIVQVARKLEEEGKIIIAQGEDATRIKLKTLKSSNIFLFEFFFIYPKVLGDVLKEFESFILNSF